MIWFKRLWRHTFFSNISHVIFNFQAHLYIYFKSRKFRSISWIWSIERNVFDVRWFRLTCLYFSAHFDETVSFRRFLYDFSVVLCRFHSSRSQQPNIPSFRSLSSREWAIVLGDAFELKICFRAYQDFTQLNIRISDCHEIQFDSDFGSVNIGKRVNANLNGSNVKSIYFIRFSHEIQLSMWLSNWIHRGSPLDVKDIWTL